MRHSRRLPMRTCNWGSPAETFFEHLHWYFPIGSMYGISAYIYHTNQPNVGKNTIHGSYGFVLV